jgi:SAM-dependent methyltransferase
MSSISKDDLTVISRLFNKTEKTDEFELIIVNHDNKYFGQEKYIQLLKYLKHRSINMKSEIKNIDILDVVYSHDENTNYRASISGVDMINKYISQLDLWKSHVIFKSLVRISKEKKDIKLMKKIRNKDNTHNVEDFNMRFKLSKEQQFSDEDYTICENISYESISKISFRLKQRSTLYIVNNSNESLQIDLTTTKTTFNYKTINDVPPIYEVEIEYQNKVNKVTNTDTLDKMILESMIIHKIIQQSNFVITNTIKKNVLNFYKNIANVNEQATFLEARQPISLEIQYLTETLPNKYTVTDKADGDRYFLIIMESHVYFISTNLNVKDSGIQLKTAEYNGTILDGEYIFIPKLNRHIYLIFDCLFIGLTDMRNETKFMERIKKAEELCSKIFIFDKQQGFKKNTYKTSGEFNIDDYKQFHKKEYTRSMHSLNNDIKFEPKYPLIRTKYFIDVLGAQPWEIFSYAEMMWKDYTENSEIGCPYILDGMIFQPLDQQYITNQRESKLFEYKWKPPQKNSIDFYIQFERDKTTGKILTVYDNSNDDYVRNKSYRICKLYCGKFNNQREVPELFNEEQQMYWAYLFLENGEVRDADGNIITDGTVVEFYYNDQKGEDIIIPERFRWVPIRTRYDKTESVLRFHRKYGNNLDVAMKVWRSIQNPILYSDFQDLSKGNNPNKNQFFYDVKVELLRKRIGHELIVSVSQQNIYYQKIKKNAETMRTYHNWIKSNIIYTYCNKQYKNDVQQSVLDIGCGVGGDIMKFYYVAVAYYVGVDIAKEGIFSAVNGAISRYNNSRKNKPNFPKMEFIHADCGTKLTYEDQNRVLGGMNNDNRLLMNKYFGSDAKKFDVVNCQFVMHYFLKDQITWDNFKSNLNKTLKPGGFFIATHFDAKKVIEYLGKEQSKAEYITDDKGKKQKLFEIIKKYAEPEKDKPIGPGAAIDLFAAWMFNEGEFFTEYLVDTEYVWKDLEKDCDLEVIESDLFYNLYYIHEQHFKDAYKYEHNVQTLKFLTDTAKYYEDTEMNIKCRDYTFLHRYCIYKKKENSTNKDRNISRANKETTEDVKQISRQKLSKSKYDPKYSLSKSKYDPKYSLMNSIHYSLQAHQIIPKSSPVEDFYKDFGIDMIQDSKLDKNKIKQICKKLKISHELENGKEHVLVDGLNIATYKEGKIEEYIDNGKNKKTMIIIEEDDTFAPIFLNTDKGKQSLFNNFESIQLV